MPPVKLEAARFGGGAADSTPQYGPIKGAAKFRQNSAGHWIHSETGRFASLSDLHEMHGALGTPHIVPRVVDSATGQVLRNPEPRVEWNAPAIQTSGVVQGANIQHQQHFRRKCFPHSVRQTFQQFLQRCSNLCFLCYAKNSLLCFRPFPEVTLLARRRRCEAVM